MCLVLGRVVISVLLGLCILIHFKENVFCLFSLISSDFLNFFQAFLISFDFFKGVHQRGKPQDKMCTLEFLFGLIFLIFLLNIFDCQWLPLISHDCWLLVLSHGFIKIFYDLFIFPNVIFHFLSQLFATHSRALVNERVKFLKCVHYSLPGLISCNCLNIINDFDCLWLLVIFDDFTKIFYDFLLFPQM